MNMSEINLESQILNLESKCNLLDKKEF